MPSTIEHSAPIIRRDTQHDSLTQPAMTPPEGVISNFVNPDNFGGSIYGVGYGFTAASFTVFCLRMYTRGYLVQRGLGSDDYTIIMSMAFALVFAGVTFKDAKYGIGIHQWNIPLEVFSPHFLFWEILASGFWALAVTTAKISILLLYLRLSPDRNIRLVIYVTLFMVVGNSLTSVCTLLLGCMPVSAIWDLAVIPIYCINRNTAIYATSTMNIVSDFAMLLLPIAMFWNLQVPLRQKLALLGLFLTGGFVCAIGIFRTALLTPLFASPDHTYNVVDQYIWCFVEINVGIICASVCTLKPFFRKHLPFLVGKNSSSIIGDGMPSRSKQRCTAGPSYQLDSIERGDLRYGCHRATAGDPSSSKEDILAAPSTPTADDMGSRYRHNDSTRYSVSEQGRSQILKTTHVSVTTSQASYTSNTKL